jgi:putative hemolysin
MALEVVLIFILILANGLLSLSEMAIVASRKARLQRQADTGDKKSGEALSLAQDPSDFLSTVQIGITAIGVLAGVFGGATIADNIAAWLNQFSMLAPYSNGIAVGIVVLVITYFTLVLGELAPKRLALNNPEQIARSIARPMRGLARLMSPLVRLLSLSTNLVLRLLGIRPSEEPPVTEEEFKVLMQQGTQAGVFVEAEQDMIEGVLELADRRVIALMTPRTEIIWLDLEDAPEVNLHKISQSQHSRLVVAEGDLDNVQGIIHARNLLSRAINGEPLDLRASLTHPLYVPESMPALKTLELFRQSGTHLALVIDEFGGLQGLITYYDILEAIVGDMPSIGEPTDPRMVQRADGSWLIDGKLPVDDFKEAFAVATLPDESTSYYQTMGGFFMTYLGRIPSVADHFYWGGMRFEIVDMDGLRVDKILVTPDSPINTNLEPSQKT